MLNDILTLSDQFIRKQKAKAIFLTSLLTGLINILLVLLLVFIFFNAEPVLRTISYFFLLNLLIIGLSGLYCYYEKIRMQKSVRLFTVRMVNGFFAKPRR